MITIFNKEKTAKNPNLIIQNVKYIRLPKMIDLKKKKDQNFLTFRKT